MRSLSTSTSTAAGRSASICGSRLATRSTMAMTLAPGWRWTLRMIAGVLFAQARELGVLGAADDGRDVGQTHRRAVAVGDDRCCAIVWSALVIWSLALMVEACDGPSKLPLGMLTLALPIVVRTSSMLRP